MIKAHGECWMLPQLECKSQTPLIWFVVDLLYNKLYNKSMTNPQQIESCTTNPQQVHNKSGVYNKSTTSRHVEMLYNKSKAASKSTTNPQQIEEMEFSYKDISVNCEF